MTAKSSASICETDGSLEITSTSSSAMVGGTEATATSGILGTWRGIQGGTCSFVAQRNTADIWEGNEGGLEIPAVERCTLKWQTERPNTCKQTSADLHSETG